MARIMSPLDYHERSKHRLRAYAPGPGRLDWANQPNPFRTFEGAPRIQLPLAADAFATRYQDVRAGILPQPAPVDAKSVAILFELAFGLSAWKAFGGNRWALMGQNNLQTSAGQGINVAGAGYVSAPAGVGGVQGPV